MSLAAPAESAIAAGAAISGTCWRWRGRISA